MGTVSATSSLLGSTAEDRVGSPRVRALTNGNYVVRSPEWDSSGIPDVGAATWGDGATSIVGAVSTANSMYGTSTDDKVGSGGGSVLTNGSYVVRSTLWDNGGVVDAGALTWGDGTEAFVGAVSSGNSLVGSQAGKGSWSLANGNYVVSSWSWDDGGVVDAGAVTWGDGVRGITGNVTRTNSLVGSTAGEELGKGGVRSLENGDSVVLSPTWDNRGCGSCDVRVG